MGSARRPGRIVIAATRDAGIDVGRRRATGSTLLETGMKPIDVLFLCETNAATSLMAEALVNARGDLRLRAFSAGRMPAARMVEEVREVLGAHGVPADSLEPKSWSIFALPGARRPDVVVDLATVSWTNPEIADLSGGALVRWPLRDPALMPGRSERRAVAAAVMKALAARIERHLVGRLAATVVPAAALVPPPRRIVA